MGILLRILGLMWLAAGFAVTLWSVRETMARRPVAVIDSAFLEAGYAIGAFIGSVAMLTPIWLTGIVFSFFPAGSENSSAARTRTCSHDGYSHYP